MKKFLLGALAVLMTVGAGCNVPLFSGQVKGDWYLAFDLPEGWVMVEDYQEPSDEVVVLDLAVDRSNTDVVVQSTNKAVIAGAIAPEVGVDTASYVTDDYAQIHVFHMESRNVIPSDAEDLGNGFSRVKLCDDGADCTIYGQYNYAYYLETETGKYKFTITASDENQVKDAIDVIMTAKEVTEFTSSAVNVEVN